MQVRLMPPFGDSTWMEIGVPSEISVSDFLARVADVSPRTRAYLRDTTEETFHHLILLRGDYVMKPGDTVSPSDRVTVVMPLTGG